MRCVQARKQLQLYIDHRLQPNEMRILEAHLVSCTGCCHELMVLEEISTALTATTSVLEPTDLTVNIMRRVAQDVETNKHNERVEQMRRRQIARRDILLASQAYMPFRPSLQELLAVLLLASITMLGIILTLPSLRSILPFTNGHDPVSHLILSLIHTLATVDSSTLMWMFWIFGTVIGVSITLALAGNEVRRSWLKAMTDRLPVW